MSDKTQETNEEEVLTITSNEKQNILKRQNTYNVVDFVEILNEMPLGVYKLVETKQGVDFDKVKDLRIPNKIYGDSERFVSHVINGWENASGGNIGVLLVGEKGLGKSLEATMIALRANAPIILVDQKLSGLHALNEVKGIKRDIVVFIDEFEKIIKTENQQNENDASLTQEEMLNFLDSGSRSKHKILFLVTSNSKYKISEFLINRPGRIKYLKHYESISDSMIRDIIEDKLKNKDFLADLIKHLPYDGLNTDALIEIINEINIHNKPYSEFKDFFNFASKKDANFEVYLLEGKREKLLIGGLRSAEIQPDQLVGTSNTNNRYYSINWETVEPEHQYKCYEKVYNSKKAAYEEKEHTFIVKAKKDSLEHNLAF